MSQIGSFFSTIPTPQLEKLTGNTGGPVSPDGSNNINIVGSAEITVTGDPGTNTLTISSSAPVSTSTTYVATTPYTVLTSDDVILIDTATIAAPSNVILADAPSSDGQVWTIKDWSGQSATYPITINTVSSLSIIDGQTTFVLANGYESVSVVWSVSESTYSIVTEVLPSVISLPTTTASSGYVEIAGTPVLQAYGTANIFVGPNGGNFSLSGTDNTSVGYSSSVSLTTGSYNVAVGTYCLGALQTGEVNTSLGYGSMSALVSGSSNCCVGENGLSAVTSGSYNLAMGQFAGANYTSSESSNILFNNGGTLGESNTLRIGSGTGTSAGNLSSAWICGIQNVNLNTANVVVNTGSSDQLGTALLTPGSGITITPGTNTITIAATAELTSTTFTSTNPYVTLPTDYVILVDTVTIGAPTIVELIEAPTTDGQTWTIKDATGAAGSGNTITIQSVSVDVNIDNATTYVINSAFQSITVVWSASQSQYYII